MYGFAEMMPRGGRRNWPLLAWRWVRTPRFSPFELTENNRTVAGFNLVHLFERLDLFSDAIDRLLILAGEGRIRPIVGATFPFNDAPSAHEHLQSRRSTGKVVLSL